MAENGVNGSSVEDGPGGDKSGTEYWPFPNQAPSSGITEEDKKLNLKPSSTHIPSASYKIVKLKHAHIKPDEGASFKFEAYPMLQHPHGRAVIITNSIFDHLKPRQGSDIDEGNLEEAVTSLGYKVDTYRNLKASEIKSLMETVEYSTNPRDDSFICCILSYGEEEGVILGSDCEPVEVTTILKNFTADKCRSLGGKPKMFFIQASAGDEIQDETDGGGTAVTSDGDRDKEKIPMETDFFIAYATPDCGTPYEGSTSPSGSPYITELCQVLRSQSRHEELHQMMIAVNAAMAAKIREEKGKYDMPEFRSRLRKCVYFCNGGQ